MLAGGRFGDPDLFVVIIIYLCMPHNVWHGCVIMRSEALNKSWWREEYCSTKIDVEIDRLAISLYGVLYEWNKEISLSEFALSIW